ncbi:MAG: G5 domain-containing protein [Defluviitaleaceae bacterium]|nr:G5 domain-containing protein [Defluviitaleaceae bacterium]
MDRQQQRPPVRRPQTRPPVRPSSTKKQKQQKPVKRDWTLLILEAFGRIGGLIAASFRNLRRGRYFRLTILIVIVLGVIGGGTIFISLASRPNAVLVAVNGENLGIARWDRGIIDPEYLTGHTITRLESQFGTTITLADEVDVRATRARRSAETITFDAMVTTLADMLEFYVYGAIITVNGRQEAKLGSAEQAEGLLSNIIEQFIEYDGQRYSFVENVIVNTANIHKNDVMTANYAETLLTTHRPVQEIYIVRQGDNLYNIARRFGMSLSQLLAANPNVNPDGRGLRENDPLVVTPTVPAISVRTYERVTVEQALPPPTEHRPNPAMPTGQQRIIQEGRAGQALFTMDIISINGVEVERVTISQQNTNEPLPQIIEVGSG